MLGTLRVPAIIPSTLHLYLPLLIFQIGVCQICVLQYVINSDILEGTAIQVAQFNVVFNCYRPHPIHGGRYCFQLVCQSTPRQGGGGTLARSGWWGGGGYPGQVWMVGGWVPTKWWEGYLPGPGLDGGGGGYRSQVWMVGGIPTRSG